jgi:DNA-binding transcriptional regulator YbjK
MRDVDFEGVRAMFSRNRSVAPDPDARPIDVPGALLAASSRVPVAQLAQQGKKTISLLSRVRMAELINNAVRQLVDRFRDEAAAAAVPLAAPSGERSAVENLQELLQQYEETSKAKADLESSRQLLHQELDELREHIAHEKARAEGLIEEDSDTGQYLCTPDFDRELSAIITRVFENRKSAIAPAATPEALKELEGLKSPIHDLVFKLVKAQREQFRARTGPVTNGIPILEKRIMKLYSQLGELENVLRAISASKVQNNQAVLTALRQLGLLDEDKYLEKKKEMLKIVLDTNKDIRNTAKDLEAHGITLSSPRRQLAS